ncbi:class I glutamine amidotransferase-like protein [Haematococcus lacustris]
MSLLSNRLSDSAAAASRSARLAFRRSVRVSASAAASKPWKKKYCRLVLEDGSVWWGSSFGAKGTEVAEVVFNTSMSGYQEIMTDPSYKGQFVAFTCPHIGNVGINTEDMESDKCHLGGIIVRDLSVTVSNYRSSMTLEEYCKKENVMGISDLDTRALTKALRDTGCLVGVLTTDESKADAECVAMAKSWTIVGKDLLSVVTCEKPYEWRQPTDAEWEFAPKMKASSRDTPFHVVAYDFGIKLNILRRLASFGCRITVVPATWPAAEVLKLNPDGVFFSNGPGDPSAAPYAVNNAKAILGKKPVFGICMGHQILGQAFGGKTFKLKFGHHGGNHPIRAPQGRIEVSAQNHNFAVDPATLPAGVEVSHINLNDGTCAGMVWADKRAMTIQYHPEASPGPHDADVCFEQFVEWMRAERAAPATV